MTESPDRRVISGTLFRERRASVTFREAPPPAPPGPVQRPARVARMLGLAHHIQRAIEAGTVPDQAAVARRLGLTRARVTQFLDLVLLALDIQEAILVLEAVDGVEPITERALRAIARSPAWVEQRLGWGTLSTALKGAGRTGRCEGVTRGRPPR